jgi:hypothetical protein
MRLRIATLAAVLLGGVALGATPAAAAADSTHYGDCHFTLIGEPDNDVWHGEIDVQTLVYSPTPEENPVSATVHCYFRVNGVRLDGPELTVPGTVAIAGAGVVHFAVDPVDYLEICTEVDFTSNATPTTVECQGPTPLPYPGPIDWWSIVDPLVCPVFAQLPALPPAVHTTPEGDVYVSGELWWDCPPYGV